MSAASTTNMKYDPPMVTLLQFYQILTDSIGANTDRGWVWTMDNVVVALLPTNSLPQFNPTIAHPKFYQYM